MSANRFAAAAAGLVVLTRRGFLFTDGFEAGDATAWSSAVVGE